MKGVFITFEGTEGSGKSTQIHRLAAALRSQGREAIELREPGGTAIGEEIRHLLKHSEAGRTMTPETELLLMCASRAQLVREIIRPALSAGHVVLCDRFYDSTVAYQGHGRGLGLAQVRAVIDFAVGGTLPDLTLFLHVPVEVSEARRAQRERISGQERDRFETAARDFFQRVEAGYQEIARSEPERIKIVDATVSIEAVQAAILAAVDRLI